VALCQRYYDDGADEVSPLTTAFHR
jgi:hypothetical protein